MHVSIELRKLNDRISVSKIHESGRFITHEEISLLKQYIPSLEYYISQLYALSIRIGTTLNALDFDDTVHSRNYQLQEGILQDNRGYKGNEIIDNIIGREKILDKYYKKSSIVKRMALILESQNERQVGRINTAGGGTCQISKIKETGVYDKENGAGVVKERSQKIHKLLDTIISLGYIPSKIIIYEDKPDHFQAIASALSKFLGGTEIIINHVLLSQQEVIKKQIQEIRQGIYIAK